jgi:hypothetical protein
MVLLSTANALHIQRNGKVFHTTPPAAASKRGCRPGALQRQLMIRLQEGKGSSDADEKKVIGGR